jgi:hypothetical protein
VAIAVAAGLLGAAKAAPPADPLLAGFRSPPHAARPQVWWHWMNGNITLEGAKLDLAWMKRIGIGGVHTFSGGGPLEPQVVKTPLPFMSPGWRDVFRETTQIARDSGMDVTIAGSPGWSQTGGVWVAPRDAMKKYVWSEVQVEGGRPFEGVLPRPPVATGPFLGAKVVRRGPGPVELKVDLYEDSVVIAYPTPAADVTGPAAYSSSAGAIDLAPLAAGDLAGTVSLPLGAGQIAWVQAAFERPVTLAAVTLGLRERADVEVQASDDGVTFRTLTKVAAEHAETVSPQQTYAFAAATAKVFRIMLVAAPPRPPLPDLPAFMSTPAPPPKALAITRLAFEAGARVNRFEAKAGFQPSADFTGAPTPAVARGAAIPGTGVIDLTAKLRPDGRLDWTPPPGRWTVLRFGWSLTGQTNGPAEDAATGLEVDKLDPVAVRGYVEHYLGLYAQATGGKLGAKGVQNLLTDSWEAGVQNWTPTILAQFKARRGYDAAPYLPVLAGRVVDDADTSDRFLWDFRRTLKEMLADNHQGVIASTLHARGMGYYSEALGDGVRAIGDGMTMKARADIPAAEYWYRPFAAGVGQPPLKADLEEAASAAHVYGKPFVAAEALTVAAGTDPWSFSPNMLKVVADEIFARGVNRILMHESHHQPLVDAKPGLEMLIFGQYFNRNDTWAEDAGPWVSYLARTSFMLQQGRYVADVAYVYGEDRNLTELFEKRFNTDVPVGYRYDYINPEALMTRLSVRDGRVVTPSGMSYRVLYLPPHVTRLTLPALRKLADLARAGAVVVGPKPMGGLGLQSPDAQVRALADQVWGPGDGSASGHAFGKGRVYAAADLAGVLAAEKIAPDVAFGGLARDGEVLSLHRRTPDADIYFVSNQRDRAETFDATFRVAGKAPELWRAEDGRAEPLSYRATPGGVTVPLTLEPHEAAFVVFRRKATAPAWTAPKVTAANLATIEGPWTVSFEPGRGAPATATFDTLISWPTSADAGVKYFSGAATYAKTIEAPASWFAPGRRLLLDLGEVRELAVVSVDGKPVATSWHAPYRVDLTGKLRPGANRLEIKVVNLWVNRLVGDKQPGAVARAFAPQSPYKADSELRPSGLLGPVRIVAEDRR